MNHYGKWAGVAILTLLVGCGMLADKERIRIAKIDNRYITRGDLFKIIREMSDDERPNIQNKGDLLRVLNSYIDDQIKEPLGEKVGQEFEAKGKELVPRNAAKQRYFEQNKDYDYQTLFQVSDPSVLGMTQLQLDAMRQEVELNVDRVLAKMKGEMAILYKAAEAYKNKTITVEQSELEREYGFRKNELKKLEWIAFRAIRFPTIQPNAETEAANVRKRLDNGEKFTDLVQEYAQKIPGSVIESEIENNPSLEKFRGFWINASDAKKDDIIGPVYLPEYQIMGQANAQGKTVVKTMPDAYLILQVLDHRPETSMTLEEAKNQLIPTILVSKMIQQLRNEHSVEIYEKDLPDPNMFSEQLGSKPPM